jgi:hypothetical protein
LASLASCHWWGECGKSCAHRTVCFCNRTVELSVFLGISSYWHIGSQTTSKMPPGYFRDNSWSVQQRQVTGPRWALGLWYMVTAITWLRQLDPTVSDSRWRLSFKITRSLWNYSGYIPHNKYNLYNQAAFASHLWTDMFQPTGHH